MNNTNTHDMSPASQHEAEAEDDTAEAEDESTFGSRAIQLLEQVYTAAKLFVPELPPVAFTLRATGNVGGGWVTLGHFSPNRFDTESRPVHEINVTGATIARGARSLVITVLHEAAHAYCQAQGIRETSRQNRYHNKRFVQAAELLGLTYDLAENYTEGSDGKWVLAPDKTIGFSNVGLDPRWGFAGYWEGWVDTLESEFPFAIGKGAAPKKGAPRKVDHAYYLPGFDADTATADDLIQMSPSKLERLADYLTPGLTFITYLDQQTVLDLFADLGGTLTVNTTGQQASDDAHPYEGEWLRVIKVIATALDNS